MRLVMRSGFVFVVRLIGPGFYGCFMLAPGPAKSIPHFRERGYGLTFGMAGLPAIVQILSLGRLIILRLMRQTNVVDFFAPRPRH
jgi:hypothetical protein